MSEIEIQIKAKTEELDKAKEKVAQLQDSINNFKGDAEGLAKLNDDLKAAQAECAKTAEELEKLGGTTKEAFSDVDASGTLRPLKEIQQEINATVAQITKLQTELRNMGKDANPDSVKDLEDRLAGLKEKQKSLTQEFENTKYATNNFATNAAASFQNMSNEVAKSYNLVNNLTRMLGGTFAMGGIINLGKQIMNTRSQFQQLTQSFTTLLQSKDKADDLMKQLTKTALTTPFEMTDVATGAKMLLAYGQEVEKVDGLLVKLGDIAAGTGRSMTDLVQLYGTTVVKDSADAIDMKQFQARGIAIKKAIAEVLNISEKEVDEAVSKHEVTGEVMEKAIDRLAGANGLYSGMMAAQSKTLGGAMSNLQDSMDQMYNEIGTKLEGVFTGLINSANYLIENYDTILTVVEEAVAAFGTYKTAVLINTIAHGEFAQSFPGLAAGLKSLKDQIKAITEVMSKNQIALAAAAIAAIGVALYELYNHESEAEQATKAVTESFTKMQGEAIKETTTLKQLTDTLQAAKEEKDKYATAETTATEATEASVAMTEDAVDAMNASSDAREKEAQTAEKQAEAITSAAEGTEAEKTAKEATTKAIDDATKGHEKETDAMKAQAEASGTVTERTKEEKEAKDRLQTTESKTEGIKAKQAASEQKLASASKETVKAEKEKEGAYTASAKAANDKIKADNKAIDEANKLTTATDANTVALSKATEASDKAKTAKEAEAERQANLTEEQLKGEAANKAYADAKQAIIDKYGPMLDMTDAEIAKLIEEGNVYDELSKKVTNLYMTKAKTKATEEATQKYGESKTSALSEFREVYQKGSTDDRKHLEETMKANGSSVEEIKRALMDYDEKDKKVWAEIQEAVMSNKLGYTSGKSGQGSFLSGISKEAEEYVKNLGKEQGGSYFWTDRTGALKELAKKTQDATGAYKAANEQIEAVFASTGAEEQKSRDTKKKKSDDGQDYKGLADLAQKIAEADKKVQDVRAKAKAGLKKEDGTLYSDKDISTEEENAEKLKKTWKTITNQAWKDSDALAEERQARLSADKAYNDEVLRQAENAQKAERDMEDRRNNSLLQSMKDGYAKRAKEREINQAKDLRAIDDETKQLKQQAKDEAEKLFDLNENKIAVRKEQNGQTYTKRTFDDKAWEQSDAGQQAYAAIDARQNEKKELTNQDYARQEQEETERLEESHNNYLKQYGKYQEKRLAIAKEYDKRIADSGDEWEKKSLENQKAKELVNLDLDQFKNSDAYSAAFSDLHNAPTIMLENLSTMLEQYKTQLQEEFSDNPEAIAEFQHMITNLSDELAARDPFTALAKGMERLNSAQAKMDAATEKIEKLKKSQEGLSKTSEEYKKIQDEINLQMGEQNKAAVEAENANSQIETAVKSVTDTFQGLMNGLEGIGNAIGGITGQTVSAIGDIFNLVQTSISSMDATAEAGSRAMQAVEKASVILAIISAALQICQQLNGLFTEFSDYSQYQEAAEKLQEINKLVLAVKDYEAAAIAAKNAENSWFSQTGLASLSDSYEEASKALESYYTKANEQQEKYVDKEAGLTGLGRATVAATKSIVEQVKEAVTFNFRELAEDIANVSSFGWTDGVLNSDYNGSQVSAIDNLRIETQSYKHGTWFSKGRDQKTEDLRTWVEETYGESLFDENGMINTELAQNVIDNYGDKLQGETQETLEALIEYKEQWDEYIETLQDYVSEMYSPVVDDMTDALMNWLDTGEDVLDTFEESASSTFRSIAEEMLQTMVQEQVFGDYEDQMQALYEEYATANATGTGMSVEELATRSAALTEEVIGNFEANSEGLMTIASTISDAYESIGINIKDTSDEQEATTGAFQTMSEDTASELNGRFTALQISGETVATQAQLGNASITTMLESVQAGNSAMISVANLTGSVYALTTQIADILSSSYLELQEISDHTASTVTALNLLQSDITKIRKKVVDEL